MFVGHLAVGLTAKCMEPKISVGTWMLAAMLADMLVFPFMIAGLEKFRTDPGVLHNRMIGHVPYSHSLLMDTIWAALFAGAYFLWRRRARGAWLLFAAVLSHWLLDVVSHRADMQLAPGVPITLGLELWNSIPATLSVEGGFWLLALIVYVRATRSNRRTGAFAFWIGVALLTLAWYGNITAGIDPNPVRAGINGLVFFSLMIAWAFWIDRLRPARD